MNAPLRIGVAGLGTVGSALVRLIDRHGNDLAVRCGRPITIAGVSAREPDPGPRHQHFAGRLVRRSGGARPRSRQRRLRRADRRRGGAGRSLGRGGDRRRQACRHRQQGAARGAWRGAGAESRDEGRQPQFRGGGGRRHPDHQDAPRVARRQHGEPHLRHPQRHLELHPDPDGAGQACPSRSASSAAQRLGYAEADPTFDIGGHDAAHKLALLTAIAFGTEIDADAIYVEGISSIRSADIEAADELGYRIKLLGVASRTDSGIEQRVHPAMVPKSSAIARIDGVTNAVAVEADFVGQLVLSGPGAGGEATASSVMSDIADIARGDRVGTFGRPASELEPYRRAAMRAHEGGYYVRLAVYDRPGAFAAIAQRMADKGISLESIVQRRRAPKSAAPEHLVPVEPQPVIMITYETTEEAIRDALETIKSDGHIAEEPQMIRIEELG